MEMVAGLPFITSKWPNENNWTKRCRNRAILPNRLCIGKKSVANPVDICRCTPRVNAFCAANLMHRRAVSAVCADEYWSVDFASEILQESGKQNDCARHVMRKMA